MNAVTELRRLMSAQEDRLQVLTEQAFERVMYRARMAARRKLNEIQDCPVEFDGSDDIDPASMSIVCENLKKRCIAEGLRATYAANRPGQLWVQWIW